MYVHIYIYEEHRRKRLGSARAKIIQLRFFIQWPDVPSTDLHIDIFCNNIWDLLQKKRFLHDLKIYFLTIILKLGQNSKYSSTFVRNSKLVYKMAIFESTFLNTSFLAKYLPTHTKIIIHPLSKFFNWLCHLFDQEKFWPAKKTFG